jgi:hypothetical protein
MTFAAKVNSVSKDPKVHTIECSEVRKRGGVGVQGQTEWRDFNSYEAAVAWADSQGYGKATPCKKCTPNIQMEPTRRASRAGMRRRRAAHLAR